jgi:hypothetical protein
VRAHCFQDSIHFFGRQGIYFFTTFLDRDAKTQNIEDVDDIQGDSSAAANIKVYIFFF